MKKIILFISLFLFIPVLNAEQTYYDWELEKVDTLPTASESTLNKVYQVENKYYITNKIPGDLKPLEVGASLNNVTLIFDFPDNYYEYLKSEYSCSSYCSKTLITDSITNNTTQSIYYEYASNIHRIRFSAAIGFTIYEYNEKTNELVINNSSFTFNTNKTYDHTISKINNTDVASHIQISSKTTYNWKEINKTSVVEYDVKIYVPELKKYKCYVVQSEGVIRGYEEIPQNNTTINYRDYYINSDYIFKDGHQTFGSTSTLPICLSTDTLTNEVYYRVDFYKILIMFLIITIITIYIPLKIFFRLFKRGGL